MPANFKITGDKALMKKFDNLTDAVRGKAQERALVAGALIIQNAAKQAAPVETGNLRRSIHIGGHDDLGEGGDIVDRAGTRVPRPEIDRDTVAVYVGTDVVYAAAVEYGGKGTRAQPYLRPALDENKNAVQKEVTDAFLDLIEAAVR